MNAIASPEPIRAAPIALWRIARAFLCVLHDLFGGPEDVAFRHTLTAEAYTLLLSWLRCAEAMLRRLLLIEAAAFPKPNTRPLLHPSRKRARKLMSFSADAPEAWRVSFRCFDGRENRARGLRPRISASGKRNAPPDAARSNVPSFRSAWPLAERYEALIRVFNNPEPYARRLAKRLHAAPHRLREVLRAPEEARHRIDEFEAMGQHGAEHWSVTPNTS